MLISFISFMFNFSRLLFFLNFICVYVHIHETLITPCHSNWQCFHVCKSNNDSYVFIVLLKVLNMVLVFANLTFVSLYHT